MAALIVGSETGTILGLVAPGEITLLLVGAMAGDSIGYLAGRRLGPRLRTTRLGQRVGNDRWEKADALLRRHGGRAVFLGRFVAFARTLVPRLAGISGLPYREFLPWDAAGAIALASGTVLLGYAAGRSYETVTDVFGKASSAVLALVL